METDLSTHIDRTTRYLQRRVPARLVEDVAQDTALEAWIHRTRSTGAGYVLGIARHEASDALRRQHRERARFVGVDEEHAHDPRGVVEAHAQLGEVFEFVGKRPDFASSLRWILEEHAGTTFEEIASREGLTPAAVRKRVSRLRRVLLAAFAAGLLALGVTNAWTGGAPTDSFTAAALVSDGTFVVVRVDSDDPRAVALRGARVVLRPDRLEVAAHGKATSLPLARTEDGVAVLFAGVWEPVSVSRAPSGELAIRSRLGALVLEKSP